MVSLIINTTDFKDFTNQEGLSCVILKANWDKTSLKMSVIFDRVALRYQNQIHFAKLDIDNFTDVVKAEKVGAIPEFLIYSNGKVVSRRHCTQETDLDNFLKKLVMEMGKEEDY